MDNFKGDFIYVTIILNPQIPDFHI